MDLNRRKIDDWSEYGWEQCLYDKGEWTNGDLRDTLFIDHDKRKI